MLVDQEKPDDGTLKLGETVKISYVDQSRDALEGDKSVWDVITGGAQTIVLGKRDLMERFRLTDERKKKAPTTQMEHS